ncbi:MAG: hypothetical protein ABIO70_35235 [Pseudomonadota bacterium]
MSRPLWLLLLALACAGGAAAQATHTLRGASPLEQDAGSLATLPDVPDPHGARTACAECHGEGAAKVASPGSDACRRCHPGATHHLDGVEPDEIHVPEALLLQAGRLTCATCHDEPACEGLGKLDRGVDHLRNGPYDTNLDLCYRCHERAAYQRTDPHRDLRTPDGQRNRAVCIFCHQGVPESRDDEKVLAIDPVELCKGCHASQIHIGIPTHLVRAEPELVTRIEAWNAQATYPLPLGPRGEITCTTCHDPHPGMDPPTTTLGPRGMDQLRLNNHTFRDRYFLPRIQGELGAIHGADGQGLRLADGPRRKEGLLRVPVEDGSLCMVCHVPGEHL